MCLAVELVCSTIVGSDTNSRLFERLVLRFKFRDDGTVVRRAAHGRSLVQSFELATYRGHPIVDLLAQWLI
jgi:hypothetical protein